MIEKARALAARLPSKIPTKPGDAVWRTAEDLAAASTTITALADRLAEVEKHLEDADATMLDMNRQIVSLEDKLATATEALRAMDALVVKAQAILTETLIGQPSGLSDKAGLNALLRLFDGPEQRAAQGLARTALSSIEAGTAEHPDSVKLRDLVRAIQKHGDYDTHIAGLLEPFLGGTNGQ